MSAPILVGIGGENITLVSFPNPMTKDEAIELAAKLLVMAGDYETEKVRPKMTEFANS